MPPKENDRRVMRTRRALQQALIALLQERELKDISVSELTARADVSRGTFYLHYPDVYELYACTENEMMPLSALCSKGTRAGTTARCTPCYWTLILL